MPRSDPNQPICSPVPVNRNFPSVLGLGKGEESANVGTELAASATIGDGAPPAAAVVTFLSFSDDTRRDAASESDAAAFAFSLAA
jgi:hypothetical protein